MATRLRVRAGQAFPCRGHWRPGGAPLRSRPLRTGFSEFMGPTRLSHATEAPTVPLDALLWIQEATMSFSPYPAPSAHTHSHTCAHTHTHTHPGEPTALLFLSSGPSPGL